MTKRFNRAQQGRTVKKSFVQRLILRGINVLALAAGRMVFEDTTTEVNMSSNALRKWRKHLVAKPFLEMIVSENFEPEKT